MLVWYQLPSGSVGHYVKRNIRRFAIQETARDSPISRTTLWKVPHGRCMITIYCKAQRPRALLGYPFRNTAAHTEATPTREGI